MPLTKEINFYLILMYLRYICRSFLQFFCFRHIHLYLYFIYINIFIFHIIKLSYYFYYNLFQCYDLFLMANLYYF